VDDLALQVGKINRVKIQQPQPADAGGREVHGDRRPEPPRANAKHAGRADFLLTGNTNLGED